VGARLAVGGLRAVAAGAAGTVQAGCRLPRWLADLASRPPSRAVVLRRSRALLAGVSSAQRQLSSAGPTT